MTKTSIDITQQEKVKGQGIKPRWNAADGAARQAEIEEARIKAFEEHQAQLKAMESTQQRLVALERDVARLIAEVKLLKTDA